MEQGIRAALFFLGSMAKSVLLNTSPALAFRYPPYEPEIKDLFPLSARAQGCSGSQAGDASHAQAHQDTGIAPGGAGPGQEQQDNGKQEHAGDEEKETGHTGLFFGLFHQFALVLTQRHTGGESSRCQAGHDQ